MGDRLNNALKPLVRPHPGHAMWNILLKIQFISKTNTTSIPNTSSISKIKSIFLL